MRQERLIIHAGKDTDKMYITHSEWATLDFGHGGYKARKTGKEFKRLPFSSCCLSLTPFENPRCTPEGHIFELTHIIPWLKKHGTNPVTGLPLAAKDLIPLTFHKNAENQYHDPVTFKVFTDSTHIVAVKTSGQVYAWETIQELNVKTKNWRDLMTDEPFTRKDIITIQDPHNLGHFDINQFHYKQNEIAFDPEKTASEAERKRNLLESTINAGGATGRILSKILDKEDSNSKKPSGGPITPAYVPKKEKAYNEAHYSTNAAAASFTSMGAPVVTSLASAKYTDDEYAILNVKEKGYAQLKTSLGDINLELYCGDAPKTCFNFIMLAKKGYYKNVTFHRLIPDFMIQGGDPTGTGKGGESYFGHPFEDECKQNLNHSSRGMLSMANKGKNTNTSQFFLTLAPCKHLDYKHTVFGKVVGGMDVLAKMASIPTTDDDKPKTPIKILDVTVFVDPYEDLRQKVKAGKAAPITKDPPAPKEPARSKNEGSAIGKYLNIEKKQLTQKETSEPLENPKVKKARTGFGNFDSW